MPVCEHQCSALCSIGTSGNGHMVRVVARAGARLLGVTSGLAIALGLPAAQAQTSPPAPTAATQDQSTGEAMGVSPSQASRLYVGIDYLHWWVKNAPLSVPLVSTGPEANKEGFLVNPNSLILYGAPHAPAMGGDASQGFPGVQRWPA